MRQSLLAELANVVGEENLYTGADASDKYGQDWTRFFKPNPGAVVFARNADQVVRLVGFANEHELALVPSGGRTGLSGGAVAERDEIVVSFDKMNRILAFDEVENSVTVEAGVITAELQRYASDKGLFYPVDFASSGSSQIGGNIATNAGGIRVLRYGLTRDQITGLEVVTRSGQRLALNRGLVKNATGYDFRHLFIGSEGTLGFILEATIRLVSPPGDPAVILMALPAMEEVMNVFSAFRSRLPLTAYEFFSEEALLHVMSHTGVSRPFATKAGYYALLEFDRAAAGAASATEAFASCVEKGLVSDGVISQSEQQRGNLWRYREDISASITPFTPYKNDISVRVSSVPGFLKAVQEEVGRRYPDFEIVWFGHIGDGNLHLNILKPGDWDVETFKRKCEGVSESVMAIVARFEGSVSAEHGVGLLKRDQLGFTRSEAEIALMRAVKKAFDPNNIMNPGKLI